MADTPAIPLTSLRPLTSSRMEGPPTGAPASQETALPRETYSPKPTVPPPPPDATAARIKLQHDKLALAMASSLSGVPLPEGANPRVSDAALALAVEETIPAPPKPNGVPVVISQVVGRNEFTLPASDAFVESRNGVILSKGMLLKCDHFPALHNQKLQSGRFAQPLVEGAPNFRKLLGEPIYGTAQPTIQGIRNVLKALGAGPGSGGPPVLWVNLREEPLVYVNNRPFNPRAHDNPFVNVHNDGAPPKVVEGLDDRLKQDIIAELKRSDHMLLVHEESPDYKVFPQWLRVDPENIKTPREVYETLKREGYNVEFVRYPVGDEMAPSEKAFDALINKLKDVQPPQKTIFNCHGGRGRTTTGMVVADMVYRARVGADTPSSRGAGLREDIRQQFPQPRTDYRPILNLVRALEEGPQAASSADKSIDRSGSMQNLRDAVQAYRDEIMAGKNQTEREECRKRCQDYLRRYYYLLALDAYLKDQMPRGLTKSFKSWMDESVLRQVLTNLEGSLGLLPSPNASMEMG